jgi:hypothetical protein
MFLLAIFIASVGAQSGCVCNPSFKLPNFLDCWALAYCDDYCKFCPHCPALAEYYIPEGVNDLYIDVEFDQDVSIIINASTDTVFYKTVKSYSGSICLDSGREHIMYFSRDAAIFPSTVDGKINESFPCAYVKKFSSTTYTPGELHFGPCWGWEEVLTIIAIVLVGVALISAVMFLVMGYTRISNLFKKFKGGVRTGDA